MKHPFWSLCQEKKTGNIKVNDINLDWSLSFDLSYTGADADSRSLLPCRFARDLASPATEVLSAAGMTS
jgi:hypothetical protein